MKFVIDSEDFKGMNYRIYKDKLSETSQKSTNECKYEARIYETKQDYDKGEIVSLGLYSDLKIAKRQLVNCITFNDYYAGHILDTKTGQEVFVI